MPTLELVLWYGLATLAGALFGILFGNVYARVVAAGTTARYWSVVGNGIHGLFHDDEANFWQHYRTIIVSTLRYIARQLGAVAAGVAPLVLIFIFAGSSVFTLWARDARVTVIPNTGYDLQRGDEGQTHSHVITLANGKPHPVNPLTGATALCPPANFTCFVLRGFGFTVVDVEPEALVDGAPVLVRATRDDWNPLWPYLSDPEFLFFLGLTIGSVLAMRRSSQRNKTDKRSHGVALTDYLQARFAARFAGPLRALGNLETRFNASKVYKTQVDRPVFICGLARSGTTLLLEKLTRVDGTASHRYRDFPFVMIPLWWHRFTSVFGREQQPTERPHNDGIVISRESPDAFEEPIWQHFFPNAHHPDHPQRLNGETVNPAFERFFDEHIRKLLTLRGGARYVSKGNYNVARIEYLAKLFPDARFIVPIRHPLSHIASLVRQHQNFVDGAGRDRKIGDYLRAAGHYEFGPQRLPIALTPKSGQAAQAAWDRGEQMLGYAHQWADIYGFVAELGAADDALAGRIHMVRFEDLCGHPETELAAVLRFSELAGSDQAHSLTSDIRPSAPIEQAQIEKAQDCWELVEPVAKKYGYTADGVSALSTGDDHL